MYPEAACAENVVPFPTAKGRRPFTPTNGMLGGVVHCTSVHTGAGYSAIKHAFFGRFVCTIVCRQRSNASTLGSGRTAAGGFAWLSGACSLTAGAPFLPDCALANPARRTITAPNLAAVNTREH